MNCYKIPATENNLLPEQGKLFLTKNFFSNESAERYLQELMATLAWTQERLCICGRWVNVPRLMCWCGDQSAEYRYSGVNHQPQPWTDALLQVKQAVENACQLEFNSVMANWYRNGRDSMGCHADNEPELGLNPTLASVSFGEERLLRFRHNKNKHKVDVNLGHGDLLIMAGDIQRYWRHELPKSKLDKKARINLTFRRILPVSP